METILAFIIASGVLGFLANWIVSAAKALREAARREGTRLNIDPRTTAAVVSIALAFINVVTGGEADLVSLQSALELIVGAVITFAVAHLTHRANAL